MHPVLLQIGSLKVYSYGVFVATGFLAALWVSGREIARMGYDREKFLDMGFWVVLSSIAGARLFHVLVYWRQYAAAPLEILKLWNGGLVFYGGFIAAVAVCVWFLRRNRMPFLPVADASSLGIILGLAFGRLGCSFAGCCFGKPTDLPWAITFTDPACLAPLNVPLHPTQIYESIGGFAIFGFLYMTRDRFKTPGDALLDDADPVRRGAVVLRDLPRRPPGLRRPLLRIAGRLRRPDHLRGHIDPARPGKSRREPPQVAALSSEGATSQGGSQFGGAARNLHGRAPPTTMRIAWLPLSAM